MAAQTGIEWTDHTFNPWIGCTRISAGCDHCYAAAMSHRRGWARFEAGAPRHRTAAAYWHQPHAWNRKALAEGVRRRVFPSLCDPFDAEVDPAWRADLIRLIWLTPQLDWLLLTKRPHVARKVWTDGPAMPPNIWLGTSAETQAMADLRIPQLLAVPARVRFLSCEPLLEPVDLGRWLFGHNPDGRFLDWVIAGGESGPKARPAHPDWFRALRDDCVARRAPFFFKQWGGWGPGTEFTADSRAIAVYRGEIQTLQQKGKPDIKLCFPTHDDGRWPALTLYRYGKKVAGALLDGREWREFPDA
jgi:protein gp37